MLPAAAPPGTTPPGTVQLFTFKGIRVFLHWSWALVAIYQINDRRGMFPNIGWDIALYLSLFLIVLLHEFGHAFGSRQVGGEANQILLWPFGGIAYVRTPPRPGAYLWGIAAGPLVNVILFPILYFLLNAHGEPFNFWETFHPDDRLSVSMGLFLFQLFWINNAMLILNLLPIYPLDGGQLFRGLLWYKLGPLHSMWIAAWTGLVLGAAVAVYTLVAWESYWLAILLGLMLAQSWSTIRALKAYKKKNGGRW